MDETSQVFIIVINKHHRIAIIKKFHIEIERHFSSAPFNI